MFGWVKFAKTLFSERFAPPRPAASVSDVASCALSLLCFYLVSIFLFTQGNEKFLSPSLLLPMSIISIIAG